MDKLKEKQMFLVGFLTSPIIYLFATFICIVAFSSGVFSIIKPTTDQDITCHSKTFNYKISETDHSTICKSCSIHFFKASNLFHPIKDKRKQTNSLSVDYKIVVEFSQSLMFKPPFLFYSKFTNQSTFKRPPPFL